MGDPDFIPVYDKVVKVTHVYLGPATDRFIDRQIENHLKIKPKDLTCADLNKLIEWIKVVVSLLTEDRELIEEYISELKKIAKPKKHNTHET